MRWAALGFREVAETLNATPVDRQDLNHTIPKFFSITSHVGGCNVAVTQ
jgi:hypothetical protein